jgi:hypothetical protein
MYYFIAVKYFSLHKIPPVSHSTEENINKITEIEQRILFLESHM